jgi:sortase A
LIWAWAWTDSAVYQGAQEAAFVRTSAEPALTGIANTLTVDPKIVGRLEVPRIGMSVMVRDGIDTATLRRAAGRLPSSAHPGQAGTVVILAHRDTFFRPLRHIAQNDIVILRTAQNSFKYQVVSMKVEAPGSRSWGKFHAAPTLTLITCFPFYYVGPAPQRFIVTAKLVGDSEASFGLDREVSGD